MRSIFDYVGVRSVGYIHGNNDCNVRVNIPERNRKMEGLILFLGLLGCFGLSTTIMEWFMFFSEDDYA